MNNRREFLQKLGLFSTLCFTGLYQSFAQNTFQKGSKGFIVKADEGEILYIGNTRKAKVNIKVSKTSEYEPEMSLLSEVIIPGDGIPVHKHLNEDEFLFVQSGKVEITLGDSVKLGESGDLIYVPKETWHRFLNRSKEDVVLFFGYSPSGFEDYFRTIGTTDINQELGFSSEDWKKVNIKYGVIYRN